MNAWRMMVSVGVLLLASCASGPEPTTPVGASAPDSANSFWFVFLESGKKTPDDEEAVAKMQRGHIDNFKRLHAEQKLFAAGPMRDPAGVKRGMVVVKAPARATLSTYFQPDEYVREGYMTLNATPAIARRALNANVPANAPIEEGRIIQILRSPNAGAASDAARETYLQSLVDRGLVGGWYALQSGAISDVLFTRQKDDALLKAVFAQTPGVTAPETSVLIWPQWLSAGVVHSQ
jgi:uncharacterized protein YciI